jgi:NAD(P)-dependent dehydrogenase (short-subunit alcohol dehydrogenase family)
VVLAARNTQKGEAAADKLRGEGLDAQFFKLEVTNAYDQASAAAFLEQKFGRLDILINNAGISAEPPTGSASTTSKDVLHRTFETNFFAPVELTQALLPLLKKSGAGRIVNISSILGSQTLHADPKSPIYNFKALSYDASKAALNSFTIHLAYELRDTKIKVNSAHPWLGQNGYGYRRRADGDSGRREDGRGTRAAWRRRADRRFLSSGPDAALVNRYCARAKLRIPPSPARTTYCVPPTI